MVSVDCGSPVARGFIARDVEGAGFWHKLISDLLRVHCYKIHVWSQILHVSSTRNLTCASQQKGLVEKKQATVLHEH